MTRIGAAARIGAVQTPEVDDDDAIREILRQPGDFHMPLLDGRQITSPIWPPILPAYHALVDG